MHKVSCNIIKDMLPLYVDEVVSSDTRNLVNEHLKDCSACQKKYEAMKGNVSIPADFNTKPLKSIKQAWNRKKFSLSAFPLLQQF